MGEEELGTRERLATLSTQSVDDLAVLDGDAWIDRYISPGFLWNSEPMGIPIRTEGIEGFREFFHEWTGAYADFFLQLEESRVLSDELVVGRFRQGGRPLGSEQSVDLRYGAVSRWRDGMCLSVTNYTTFEEALAAGQRLLESDASV